MTIRYILFFIFILFIFNPISQGAVENDPKAKAILEEIRQRMKDVDAISVKFNLEMEFPGQTVEKQKGMLYQQGKKFHIDIDQQSVISDGETIWFHLKDNKEVQIMDYDEESMPFMSPVELLDQFIEEKFEYGLTGSGTEAGKSVHFIEFKPTDKYAEYSKIRLAVTQQGKEIVSFRVFNKDGSRYILMIENIQYNPTLKAGQFSFDPSKYPGLHVEDLRI